MLNQLTSNGRYKNFVQDLELKWREAYQTQQNNLNKKSLAFKKIIMEMSMLI